MSQEETADHGVCGRWITAGPLHHRHRGGRHAEELRYTSMLLVTPAAVTSAHFTTTATLFRVLL